MTPPHTDSPPPAIILASGSPRRAELLGKLGLEFTVSPANVDEEYAGDEMPAAHAERLAREKAIAGAREHPEALVIGSDTVVVLESELMGKPVDADDALRMLLKLAGREHEVHTGIAVSYGGRTESSLERVRVRFRPLDRGTAEAYVATGEPMDKAGAYGIQGFGSAIVEGITGDYFAVMGLPVVRMLELIERFGWSYVFGRLEAR